MTFHSLEDLLVLDETSRDRSAVRGLFGWGSRGSAPIERNVPHYRDQRISALVVFSARGFEDWRFTEGTYNTVAFDEAIDQMVLQPTGPLGLPLVPHFPVVLIDNATIHSAAFDERIKAAGGKVWRIPPYCAPSLSPLDNGAFGLLTRYLHIHALRLTPMSVPDAVSDALRNCCPPRAGCSTVVLSQLSLLQSRPARRQSGGGVCRVRPDAGTREQGISKGEFICLVTGVSSPL